jgi:flavodoxin
MSISSILGDSKVLICWYSKSGLTKRVVEVLGKQLGDRATLFEVKTDVNYQGFGGTMRSIWHSMMGRGKDQQLVGDVPALVDFGAFILAGPVWNYKIATPIASFLAAVDFEGKPVIPLSTAESNAKGVLEDFQPQVKNGRFVAKEGFYAVQKQNDEGLDQKVREWLQSA